MTEVEAGISLFALNMIQNRLVWVILGIRHGKWVANTTSKGSAYVSGVLAGKNLGVGNAPLRTMGRCGMSETVYTAISFAPVQGFIEKSRKLRDLYGASQILSYLSVKVVAHAMSKEGIRVVSPVLDSDSGNADLIQGTPNRILIEGKFSYNDAKSAIAKGWYEILSGCKSWIEEHPQLSSDFDFSGKGWEVAWTKWKVNAWEIFWGEGESINGAMLALETNKLRRDWIVPNWNGESSSLSGADGIAYPNMDSSDNVGSRYNPGQERDEIRLFYRKLAEALESSKQKNDPKFLAPTEWLSIPEVVKRLVTHYQVARRIDQIAGCTNKKPTLYTESFSEMLRINDKDQAEGGYWTGWFMGDGDKVGKHLQDLKTPEEVQGFSSKLRIWGRKFQEDFELGRVVYAGGDDFFGVIFGTDKREAVKRRTEALTFLIELQKRWNDGELGINLSVGFVWAGHSVPQRDVLQHCREAEKQAKRLGRNRVAIRILFNNGQFLEWVTPWQYVKWLEDYRDRSSPERKTGKEANWSHIYSDLAQLKARHAIPPKTAQHIENPKEATVALSLLGFYFGGDKKEILSRECKKITGSESTQSIVEWIEGMIQVGWQLCSNS
jgi:CRISPR-associated protein Cmr2